MKEEDIVVARCTFQDGAVDWQFLGEGVGFFMVLPKQMVIISYIIATLLPQTNIVVIF